MKKTVLIALLVLSCSVIVYAHKMHIEATVTTGATIEGDAHYHSTPVADAKVKVYAPDDTILVETVTDHHGEFTFEVSYRCELKIVVIDGGHKGMTTIPAEDLPDSLPVYEAKK